MAVLTFTSDRPRTLEEVKDLLKQQLASRRPPLTHADPAAATEAIQRLAGLDGDSWAACWGETAGGFERLAEEAEARDDTNAAVAARFQAYTFYFVGRYPAPYNAARLRCYDKERENYLKLAASFEPPLERVAIPFEGGQVVVYVRKPRGVARPPVVVLWGGVDSWKEETFENAEVLLGEGMAVVSIDMPGVGESPVKGAEPDAERQWTPVFEWIRAQPDLDASRIGCMGLSFGGYWVNKLAHTHHRYLTAAVNWGGAAHLTFQPEWVSQTRYPDTYLMNFHETRARALGGETAEDYARLAGKLSLVDQGLLEGPCAPMLLINGKDDRLTTIDDLYLMLQHGGPKTARVFPGGHMGRTPQTLPTAVGWLKQQLRA